MSDEEKLILLKKIFEEINLKLFSAGPFTADHINHICTDHKESIEPWLRHAAKMLIDVENSFQEMQKILYPDLDK